MHRLDRSSTPCPPVAPEPAASGAWSVARVLCIGALLCIASGACGSDPEPEPAITTPDAGPACEPGSENCQCLGGSGCREGLLCIARRCLPTDTEELPDPTDSSRPRPTRPPAPAPDSGGSAEPLDAGTAPPDAGTLQPADASSDAG